MQKQRFLSILLALVMCGTVACGTDAPVDSGADSDKALTTAADTEEAGLKLSVPEADLDEVITYLLAEGYNGNFRLVCDDTKGDILNEAGYKRALAVSELLNVTFETYEQPIVQVYNTLNSAVMAGEDAYDFVLPHCTVALASMIVDGLLLDWNEIEYVDFTKPWWNAKMQETLSFAGRTYFASGDITMTWQGMQGIMFNKDYLEKYKIDEDLYETVWNGEWTLDKMYSLLSGVGDDVNGDQKMDEHDQYGLVMNGGVGCNYMLAAGQPMTTVDGDGCPELAMGTEKMISIVEKYYRIINSPDTLVETYSNAAYPTSITHNIMVSGRAFMINLDVGGLYMALREPEYDFGILPLPKLDEEQDEYYVGVAAGIIGVPAIADTEVVGMTAEALAYYSYEYIRPAFFDTVLQNKALRDDESYDILTLMHESKVFDIGWNFTEAPNMLDTVVYVNKSTDFMSHYASKEESINKALRDIYDAVVEDD